MLNDNLYKLVAFSNENGSAEAAITIDASHKIFEGHFPGQPVLPGVCMMQIIKELTEKAIAKELFMHQVDSCKFLSMVDPTRTSHLKVIIEYATAENETVVQAVLKSDEAVYLKMKAAFKTR